MTGHELQALFIVERSRFAQRYPDCARARLTIDRRRCPPGLKQCGERNVAWCYPATGRVHILGRALNLSRSNLIALIRHELAHVAQPTLSERETDDVASRVGGHRIRYDAREIQTIAPRAKYPRRPAHLPK